MLLASPPFRRLTRFLTSNINQQLQIGHELLVFFGKFNPLKFVNCSRVRTSYSLFLRPRTRLARKLPGPSARKEGRPPPLSWAEVFRSPILSRAELHPAVGSLLVLILRVSSIPSQDRRLVVSLAWSIACQRLPLAFSLFPRVSPFDVSPHRGDHARAHSSSMPISCFFPGGAFLGLGIPCI